MLRSLPAVMLAAGLAAAAPALAQNSAPASPGATAAAPITELDRQFLILDAQGGVYEQSLAALARERSSRDDR